MLHNFSQILRKIRFWEQINGQFGIWIIVE